MSKDRMLRLASGLKRSRQLLAVLRAVALPRPRSFCLVSVNFLTVKSTRRESKYEMDAVAGDLSGTTSLL